ncbi:DNA directed RNA polymerase [Xylariaceae sp. FL0255]|nr:DNA directed RNA polymerase [Xylariaceae sp. FL0255]
MSREAYQIPTNQGGGASPAQGQQQRTTYVDSNAPTFTGEGATMAYICGDCGYKFALRRSDAIRCKECGCRVLYKERTKRMVQFEAR